MKNEFVTGHLKAKVLYMPAGVLCGHATTFSSHILNLRFRSIIEVAPANRTSLVVIQRSSKRWFNHHQEIWQMLESLQPKYGFKLELFSDRKMPPLQDVMRLFNRAILVIGPHGAGLSNIIFSRPETIVIEGLCKIVNLCYSRLVHVLGDIYFGIVPKNDCKDMSARTILKSVVPYLDWLKRTKYL